MNLWATQFITNMSGGKLYQQYNFEILNNTSLNFARPGTPTDSHTASVTAERKKLREQLPRLSTNTVVPTNCYSQENVTSLKKHVNSQNDTRNFKKSAIIKSPDANAEVTQSGNRVKFATESDAHQNVHQNSQKNSQNSHQNAHQNAHQNSHRSKVDVSDPYNESKEEKDDIILKKQRSKKQYRRASAPAQGMNYQEIEKYFKNAKKARPNNIISIPAVHVEVDEHHEDDGLHEDNSSKPVSYVVKVDESHQHDNMKNDLDKGVKVNNANNDRNVNSSMSSSVTSFSSTMSHCNPPSLSPCSSTSSISSSVDMLSPAPKQPNFPPAYANFTNPWVMKSKLKTIATETHESHSLPAIVSSYDNVPWSPAAMFLSSLAPTMKQPLPDEEGQQVGDYVIGKVIGHGGFSTVKRAYTVDNYSGSMENVAVKIVKNITDSDDNERIQALLEREIAIWRRLNHPNIVQMLSVEENDYATFVFSEYCPGGTLLDYVKKHCKSEGRGLDEDEARNIFLEVAEGVRYLHNDMRLVHKDIKLDNILLDNDDTWKICDFGLTEFQSSVNGFNDMIYNSAVGGSIAYCAPEQLRSPTPLKDPSVDVWSLGVLLFAMITGQLPFSDSFEPRLQFKIINGRYDESLLDEARVCNELKDLLKGMFKTKPDQRLTINQVLEHRWCER